MDAHMVPSINIAHPSTFLTPAIVDDLRQSETMDFLGFCTFISQGLRSRVQSGIVLSLFHFVSHIYIMLMWSQHSSW